METHPVVRPFVLLYDRSEKSRSALARVLSHKELFHLIHARNESELFNYLSHDHVEVVVVRVEVSQTDSERLLSEIRLRNAHARIVFYADRGSVRSAVQLIKMGASEYLTPPFNEDEFLIAVEKQLALRRIYTDDILLNEAFSLLEACQRINACSGIDSLHQLTLSSLLQIFHADRGSFFVVSDAGPRVALSEGLDGDDELELLNWVRESAESGPQEIVDREWLLKGDKWTGVVVPIATDRSRFGWVVLLRKRINRDLKRQFLRQAALLLRHIGVAFENAEHSIESRRLAQVDPLTGLYNVRYLHKSLEDAIEDARALKDSLSFLFIDLDNFKKINDSWGHLVGSRLLKEVSAIIQSLVREVDVVVRYGGDEFTVTLIQTPTDKAEQVAERIRQAVQSYSFRPTEGADPISVTVSIGVATYPTHAETKDELIHIADMAMYQSKNTTRNSVYIAERPAARGTG